MIVKACVSPACYYYAQSLCASATKDEICGWLEVAAINFGTNLFVWAIWIKWTSKWFIHFEILNDFFLLEETPGNFDW